MNAKAASGAMAWQERLAQSRGRLANLFDPTPAQRQARLHERALQLARQGRRAAPAGRLEALLVFGVAGERYGLDPMHIREVFPLRQLTRLPGLPARVRGLTLRRGGVLAVLDLRPLFDLPPGEENETGRIIVLSGPQSEFGLLADTVEGLRTVAADAFQTQLPTLTGVRGKYLRGVTPDGIAVLDALRLLDDPDLRVQDEIEDRPPEGGKAPERKSV